MSICSPDLIYYTDNDQESNSCDFSDTPIEVKEPIVEESIVEEPIVVKPIEEEKEPTSKNDNNLQQNPIQHEPDDDSEGQPIGQY